MSNVGLLVNMQYPKKAAIKALKKANNDIDQALEVSTCNIFHIQFHLPLSERG